MTHQPKTKAEAVLKLQYEIRLHELHRRLYRRAQFALSLLSVLIGSASLLPVLQAAPGGLLLSGALLAVIGAVSAVGGLADAAARHEIRRRAVADILARAPRLGIDDIEGERIQLADEDYIESLRAVAFNDALKSGGYESGMRPERRMERLMRCLA